MLEKGKHCSTEKTAKLSVTTGPIGLKFVVDTHGWQGGVIGKKIEIYFSIFFSKFLKNFFPHRQRRTLQQVYNKALRSYIFIC